MYSNDTPGPRFHEMQARERARFARRGGPRAAAHLRALESGGCTDQRTETSLRNESFALVGKFYATGGYTERFATAAPSEVLVGRHRRFNGPPLEGVHGYLSAPTRQAFDSGDRRVNGARS